MAGLEQTARFVGDAGFFTAAMARVGGGRADGAGTGHGFWWQQQFGHHGGGVVA